MSRFLIPGVLSAAVLTPVAATAQDNADLAAMRAELAAMRAELAQIKGAPADSRTADLQEATAAALEDARARINYQTEELSAGHDGKFFLESPEGDFRMNIGGQLQLRYVANLQDDSADDGETGFTLRRTKLKFDGHVTRDEKFSYALVLAGEDTNAGAVDGDFEIEDFVIGYKINDQFSAKIGQFKLPFARQELISSSRQVLADRSFATEFFTLDRGQGIQLEYKPNSEWKFVGNINDGADSENADFDEDATNIAATARAEWTVFGKSSQGKDAVAWRGEDDFLSLGAAGHVEFGETGDATAESDVYTWTVDGLYESNGFSVLGAFYAIHADDGSQDSYGLVAQPAYMLTDKFQIFGQYNFVDIAGLDDNNSIGGGFNYFIKKHNAKFTADVLFFFDPVDDPDDTPTDAFTFNEPGTGIGVLEDTADSDNQIVIRAQFQLLF
ncbi:MAG: porin [Planctomycetota bacterium]